MVIHQVQNAINLKRLFGLFLFLLFTCFTTVSVAESLPIPPVSYVTDNSHVLSSTEYSKLVNKLADFEKEVGSQIAVIIVPSTNGEPIEEYSFRVADKWRLGRKGIGDGLLLVFAINDHMGRIEVMRDLEGAIPDVVAGRILKETIFPQFVQGGYYEGISNGLDRIFDHIRMENLPPPNGVKRVSAAKQNHPESFMDEPWVAIFFIGLVFTMMLRQILGRKSAPLAGICVGGLAWYVFQSVLAGIVIALLVLCVGMLIPTSVLQAGARRTARMYRDRRYRGGFGGGFGGFGGGGFGGGGFGGGMGGGSGSGGGGSAGGGGASGSW